jgi:hypothetical protein
MVNKLAAEIYLLEAGVGFTAPCGGWRHVKDGQKDQQDISQPHLSPLCVSFVKNSYPAKRYTQFADFLRPFWLILLLDSRCTP